MSSRRRARAGRRRPSETGDAAGSETERAALGRGIVHTSKRLATRMCPSDLALCESVSLVSPKPFENVPFVMIGVEGDLGAERVWRDERSDAGLPRLRAGIRLHGRRAGLLPGARVHRAAALRELPESP